MSKSLLFCRGCQYLHTVSPGMQSSGMILCRRPARAFAYKDQWQLGTHLNSWMFRNNLWFDRTRAKKVSERTRGYRGGRLSGGQ